MLRVKSQKRDISKYKIESRPHHLHRSLYLLAPDQKSSSHNITKWGAGKIK
jgi:hypothetical protein